MQTLCARIYLEKHQHQVLLQTGSILASARHTLFKRWKINPNKNTKLSLLKKSICEEFGLSSKQFNGIRFDVEQAVQTWSGTLIYQIQTLKNRIESQQEKIQITQNKLNQISHDLNLLNDYRAYLKEKSSIHFDFINNSKNHIKNLNQVKIKNQSLNISKNIFNPQQHLNRLGYFNFNFLKFKFNPTLLSSFKWNLFFGIKNHTQAILVQNQLFKLQKNFKLSLNQHQRKLCSLQKKLAELKLEKQVGIPKICFGGSQALREANQQLSKSLSSKSQSKDRTLLDLWKLKRTAEISLVGSRDETGGNQSAIYDPDKNTLCLSLPKSLLNLNSHLNSEDTKKSEEIDSNQHDFLTSLTASRMEGLPHLTINLGEKAFQRQNGQALLKQAITKTKISHVQNQSKIKEKSVTKWVTNSPLTWKLFYEPEFDKVNSKTGQTEFAWGVRVSFNSPEKPLISKFELGCIGMDLNADHLACTRVDRFGNLTEVKTFPFPSSKGLWNQGKQVFEKLTKHQSRALIEQTCIELCNWAKSHLLPIAIEDLDFAKKKAGLKSLGYSISFLTKKEEKKIKFSHLLNSFAYSKWREALLSRARKEGIEVKLVNPAYTSQIARLKYKPLFKKKKYTIHVLASYVIGRRGMSQNQNKCDSMTRSGINKHNNSNSKNTRFMERFPKHISIQDPARSQRRGMVSRWKNASICEKNAYSDFKSKIEFNFP